MTETSPTPFWPALINALKDLRVSAHISLSVAAVSLILLGLLAFAPSWPSLTVLRDWKGYLIVGAIAGVTVFVVGILIDMVTEYRTGTKAVREAQDQREAAAAERRRQHAHRVDILENMTISERRLCASYVMSVSRAQAHSDGNPVLIHLVDYGVFERIGQPSRSPMGGDPQSVYRVADWAWAHLRAHPEIMDLKDVPPLKASDLPPRNPG